MTFITLLGWIVAGWMLLVGLMFVGQRALLYHPDRSLPNAAELTAAGFQALPVRTEDGIDLTAWHRPAEPGRSTLVLFHGNVGHHGHRLSLGLPLASRGYGVVLAPYRGYGGASGQPTEDGLVTDGRATLAALAPSVPRTRIVLWGESLGGGIATRLAADAASEGRPVQGLMLQAPFTSVHERAAEVYRFVPARWLVLDRFDNLRRIAKISAPLLIVHGEEDAVVPAAHGKRLFGAASQPKLGVFIPGADHNNLPEFGLAERMAEFLERLS